MLGAGQFGHGYEVVSADDVEQAVYEQFIKTGVGADQLDAMESPLGYIRTTARLYGAANEARSRRRAAQADFGPYFYGDERSLGGMVSNDHRYASRDGNPEQEVEAAEFIAEVNRVVESILTRIESLKQREAARAYYLDGLDSLDIARRLDSKPTAVRKALQRAREDIGPEADASLRAWREFAYPDAKRPRTPISDEGEADG